MSMIQPHSGVAVSRPAVFSAAPHRMMFFGGALQLIATVAFWLSELGGLYAGWWSTPRTVIPSVWAHAFLMIYDLFPFFMFGFLMTTYPRWMNGTVIPRRSYAAAFAWLAAGTVLFYAGLFASRTLLAVAVAILLVGWTVALRALFRVFMHAPAKDKHYERFLNAALLAGWLGIFSYALWLLGGQEVFLNFALRDGVWLFLVPVLFTVSHRMIPYFSSCVLADYRVVQPRWSLPLLSVCVAGHTVLELAGAQRGLFLFDVPMALMALDHAIKWDFRRSFRVRLLAMLHVTFLWFGIAMALYSVQSLVLAVTGTFILGLAPLHALAIGFIVSMVVAMASRVTLGHSGRPLVADDFTWACLMGVSVTALLRVAAEIPPFNRAAGVNLSVLAALAWLACLTPWALKYAPLYLRRRVDGKPG